MACPLTISKFVGTISLGLLTGISYATSTITIPSLKLLPNASAGARSLKEAKRLNRQRVLRISNIGECCLLFAYEFSPARRKHPFLLWMLLLSSTGTLGLDYWFNRHLSFKDWVLEYCRDTTGLSLGRAPASDEDLIAAEPQDDINGEAVRLEMDRESNLQYIRAWFTGIALSMGVVGLWGDRR